MDRATGDRKAGPGTRAHALLRVFVDAIRAGGHRWDRRPRTFADTIRAGRRRWERAPRGPVDARPQRPRRAVVVHSDIVRSTDLQAEAGERYPALVLRHRDLIGGAVREAGGRFHTHAGDGTLAVFDCVTDAIAASVAAQRALAAERWAGGHALRVRMAVHAGEVTDVDGEPFGLTINHGARIMAAAEPGQVVVSSAVVAAAAASGAPRRGQARYAVAEAGWHALRDHVRPVRLRQVVAEGLTVVVPPDGVIDLRAPVAAEVSLN